MAENRDFGAKSRPTSRGTETSKNKKNVKKMGKKKSEYGRQLQEKQRVKDLYGMREKQFKRFFQLAIHSFGAPADNLLSLLERRLDSVVYRLKMSISRTQARQIIVHGHILVNDKKVYSPSFLVSEKDVVSLANNVLSKKGFLENVIDKRLNIGIRVPDWLELEKSSRRGRVLNLPSVEELKKQDIQGHLIVELYSK